MALESSCEEYLAYTATGELDLEAVVARFAGDDSCTSFALPASLKPEERLLAKKLVNVHPHLECESYGFGPERQLHIFKKQCRGVRLRVKNTFIDAWLAGVDGKAKPSRALHSWPFDFRSEVATQTVDSLREECVAKDSVANANEFCDNISICSRTPSPQTSPKGYCRQQVSLTEEVLKALQSHKLSTTEHMSDESQSTSMLPSPATMPPPVSPTNVVPLESGTEVEIHGLTQRPDFNGLSGIVVSWDAVLRRYEVRLSDSPGANGRSRIVKTKRENLLSKPPAPPAPAWSAASRSTTLDLQQCLPIGQNVDAQACGVSSISPTAPLDSNEAWVQWQGYEASMAWRSRNTNDQQDLACNPDGTSCQWDFENSPLSYLQNSTFTFNSNSMQRWMENPAHDVSIGHGQRNW